MVLVLARSSLVKDSYGAKVLTDYNDIIIMKKKDLKLCMCDNKMTWVSQTFCGFF